MNGYRGVVSGREVKRGEKVLVENKYGLENLSRLTLYEASVDCNNPKRDIFNYCSPEEIKSGCAVKACSTFFIEIGMDSVFLTPYRDASDGCYLVRIFGKNSNEKKVGIVVNGELARTVNQDPPPQENPEASSPKGTETPRTDDRSTVGIPVDIPVAIPVAIAVGIAVFIAVGILAWCCLKKKKKKKNESAASVCKNDLKEMSLIESNIKADRTTGDSSEMVDRIPPLGDEDINSLKEVLIHHPSVGQENGRPGQHVHHNNSDDYDDNSKHSITNDSDFCSNFDEDDDETKSNNTNNYNDDEGVANGGDDDDGISSGDDNIKNN